MGLQSIFYLKSSICRFVLYKKTPVSFALYILYYIYERSEYINIIYIAYIILLFILLLYIYIYIIYLYILYYILFYYIYIILLLYILYYILYLYILTTFVYNNIIYNIRQNGQIGKMYTQGGHTFQTFPSPKKQLIACEKVH